MACRTERPKRELVRVVRDPRTHELAVDVRGKAPGRGAYLCADPECLERGLADGSLARALGATLDDATKERLRGDLDAARMKKEQSTA